MLKNIQSVYIQGPGGSPYETMFLSMGIVRAKSIEDADIVCFTGGEDVDPGLYGEKPLRGTYFNDLRDGFDATAYTRAKTTLKGGTIKPCIGICRGGQFLNVMNGGRLWQDIDGHTQDHILWDPHAKQEFFVTSTHHQQMIPHSSGTLVAYAAVSRGKSGYGSGWSTNLDSHGVRGSDAYKEGIKITNSKFSVPPALDSEVIWYPKTKDLCFQPHPEFPGKRGEACKEYFIDVFNRYILDISEKEGAA